MKEPVSQPGAGFSIGFAFAQVNEPPQCDLRPRFGFGGHICPGNAAETPRAARVKPLIAARAKERQGARTDLGNIPQNSAGSETRDELANIAGVSCARFGHLWSLSNTYPRPFGKKRGKPRPRATICICTARAKRPLAIMPIM